jgi:hypothetical protein
MATTGDYSQDGLRGVQLIGAQAGRTTLSAPQTILSEISGSLERLQILLDGIGGSTAAVSNTLLGDGPTQQSENKSVRPVRPGAFGSIADRLDLAIEQATAISARLAYTCNRISGE